MSFGARLAIPLVLAACAVSALSCGASTQTHNTVSPSSVPTIIVPPQPTPDPNAIPLDLNHETTGVLTGTGPWCGAFDPMDSSAFPCQSYRVATPTAATLQVHITWQEDNRTMCALNGRATLCRDKPPIDVKYTVSTGPSFTFAVGFEGTGPSMTLAQGVDVNYSVSASLVSAETAGRSR